MSWDVGVHYGQPLKLLEGRVSGAAPQENGDVKKPHGQDIIPQRGTRYLRNQITR
jgi:hypothetical protein